MNLKKIALYTLLALILISSLAACTPNATPVVVVYEQAIDHVLDQGSFVPSEIEQGQYRLFCDDNMDIISTWLGEKTFVVDSISYELWFIYKPQSPVVTAKVLVYKDSNSVMNYGIEFNKDSNSWKEQLLYLFSESGYENDVKNLLVPTDLDPILVEIDQEATTLPSRYKCVELSQ